MNRTVSFLVWNNAGSEQPEGKPRHVLTLQRNGIITTMHTTAPSWDLGRISMWAELPRIDDDFNEETVRTVIDGMSVAASITANDEAAKHGDIAADELRAAFEHAGGEA